MAVTEGTTEKEGIAGNETAVEEGMAETVVEKERMTGKEETADANARVFDGSYCYDCLDLETKHEYEAGCFDGGCLALDMARVEDG
ncbi:hypothetical protein V6N13_103242 [Hibiscus sabdariffa]